MIHVFQSESDCTCSTTYTKQTTARTSVALPLPLSDKKDGLSDGRLPLAVAAVRYARPVRALGRHGVTGPNRMGFRLFEGWTVFQ